MDTPHFESDVRAVARPGVRVINLPKPGSADHVRAAVAAIEQAERAAPYGAKGVGEPPTISSTGAVVAAIRQATSLPLTRIPVRPDDIALARRV